MSSIKIERLNHTIQQEISMILQTEVKDEHIKFVTITGVDTTSDLSYSKVYYTVLDQSKKETTQESLEKAQSFIRTKLAERIDIRHTPELKFIYDTSIAYGEHIEEIIENIHEKDQVKEVKKDMDCGMTLENCQDYKEKDIIEVYELVEIKR